MLHKSQSAVSLKLRIELIKNVYAVADCMMVGAC